MTDLEKAVAYALRLSEKAAEKLLPTIQRNINTARAELIRSGVLRSLAESDSPLVEDAIITFCLYKMDDESMMERNQEACGLATPFAEFDSQTLYEKIEAFYTAFTNSANSWQEGEKAEFDKWFATLKDQLSGDIAANLQQQINDIVALTDTEVDEVTP